MAKIGEMESFDLRLRQQSLLRAVVRGSLFAVLLGSLTFALVSRSGFSESTLSSSLRRADLALITAAALCFVLAHVADALRLQALARAVESRLSLPRAFQIIVASDFAALVTPFLSGGPVCNVWMLSRSGIGAATASALVVSGTAIARVVISAMAFSLPLIAWLTAPGAGMMGLLRAQLFGIIPTNVITGALVLVSCYNFASIDRLLSFIENGLKPYGRLGMAASSLRTNARSFHHSFRVILRNGYRDALISAFWSGLHFWMQFSVAYLVLRALGVYVSYPVAVAAEMFILIVASASPTPGGSGAAELVIAAILSQAVQHDMLIAFVVLWRLSSYWLMISLGAIAFAVETRSQRLVLPTIFLMK